ncbi:hypothetical protein Q3G72_011282 [Acer saccharum]|nr:hypothetical protein Q3G72_011282 [Acer saccharum]
MALLVLLSLLFAHSISAADTEKKSPVEFLKHLQGCHKGEKVKGLLQLKNYLEKFGYLDYKNAKNLTHENDDYFDELLESAIKTYQLNFHVQSSGVLDSKTLSEMAKPRCGVADIVNGTNWMKSREKSHHNHGSGRPFHTVSHYTFFPGRPRWPAGQTYLTYAFLPGQTLAHAFSPTDGRFHYDAAEPWAVGAVPGSFDLETVALHEIGHLLGLGHSQVQGAIMWPSIPAGTTKGLHRDDIEGIRALYNV